MKYVIGEQSGVRKTLLSLLVVTIWGYVGSGSAQTDFEEELQSKS